MTEDSWVITGLYQPPGVYCADSGITGAYVANCTDDTKIVVVSTIVAGATAGAITITGVFTE